MQSVGPSQRLQLLPAASEDPRPDVSAESISAQQALACGDTLACWRRHAALTREASSGRTGGAERGAAAGRGGQDTATQRGPGVRLAEGSSKGVREPRKVGGRSLP